MQDSDINRLAFNQQTLLDSIHEMVLLIDANGKIEYLNPWTEDFFSENNIDTNDPVLHAKLKKLLNKILNTESPVISEDLFVNKEFFEGNIATFSGYNGDDLYWLVLKKVISITSPISSGKKEDFSKTHPIVGSSPEMIALKKTVTRVAKINSPILITGESGTGKELIANMLYYSSNRKGKPFLTINCNAINDSVLENELFGHERGSYSGADSQKKGKFEAVDGGTIFLDELGDISPRMQSVLLRVIQHGEIIRVGGTKPIKVDVRILAATNKDLSEEVRKGNFRLDLYYRLNIINLHVPPLRNRNGDIEELTEFFTAKFNREFSRDVSYDPAKIFEKFNSYHWPGNVRELENVIQRAVVMSEDNDIDIATVKFDMPIECEEKAQPLSSLVKSFNGSSLKTIVDQIEKEVIIQKLGKNKGVVLDTAKELNISKASLYEKMKRYEVSAKNITWQNDLSATD